MSSIKLKHSGGNSVSLNPPTSAPTSTEVAFKLPNEDGTSGQAIVTDASGNLSFAGTGKILQVIQNVKSDTASWTGTSFSNISGTDESGAGSIWEVNITPTKANSKLLVEFSGAMGSTQGVMMAVRLVRNINDSSTSYPFLGDSGGVRPQVSRQVRGDYNSMKTHAIHQAHFTFLDSPSYSLGNKITYHLQGMGYSGSDTVYINRSGSQQNESTYDGNQSSTLTVMEVAA